MVLQSLLNAAVVIGLVVALLQLIIWVSTLTPTCGCYLRKRNQAHAQLGAQDEEVGLSNLSSGPTGSPDAEHIGQTEIDLGETVAFNNRPFPIERITPLRTTNADSEKSSRKPLSTSLLERTGTGVTSKSEDGDQAVRRRIPQDQDSTPRATRNNPWGSVGHPKCKVCLTRKKKVSKLFMV